MMLFALAVAVIVLDKLRFEPIRAGQNDGTGQNDDQTRYIKR